jgi:hypothetical protein
MLIISGVMKAEIQSQVLSLPDLALVPILNNNNLMTFLFWE